MAVVYWLSHVLRSELAYYFPWQFSGIAPFRDYKWLYLIIIPLYPFLLDFNGYYARPYRCGPWQTLWALVKAAGQCALVVVAVMYFLGLNQLSRGAVLLFAGLSVMALFLKDIAFQAYVRLQNRRGMGEKPIVLIGADDKNAEFERLLREHPEWGLRVTTRLAPTLESFEKLPALLHSQPIACVVFNVPQISFAEVERAILACEVEGIEAWLVADFVRTSIARASVDDFHGKPLLVFRSAPEASWPLIFKRGMDITGAAFGLLILGPLVMLPVAIAIKLTSPGPILFRQQRSGLRGRLFTMLKFRSMVDNAEMLRVELETFNEMSGPVFKMSQDPRVTRIGRFIRRASIDEFPQLWNVLVGDMSLVGPRPPIPGEVEKYDPWHRRRLSMKPGLTCLWQISGRNTIGFDQWMKLDLEYIDNWSLLLDFKILARTIPVVLSGFGAR